MSEILEEFVRTLDPEIQRKVSGFKNKKVIRILKELNVDIPQDLLDELEQIRKDLLSHESVIASMEPLKGNKLKDIDKYLSSNS